MFDFCTDRKHIIRREPETLSVCNRLFFNCPEMPVSANDVICICNVKNESGIFYLLQKKIVSFFLSAYFHRFHVTKKETETRFNFGIDVLLRTVHIKIKTNMNTQNRYFIISAYFFFIFFYSILLIFCLLWITYANARMEFPNFVLIFAAKVTTCWITEGQITLIEAVVFCTAPSGSAVNSPNLKYIITLSLLCCLIHNEVRQNSTALSIRSPSPLG